MLYISLRLLIVYFYYVFFLTIDLDYNVLIELASLKIIKIASKKKGIWK